jgi:hypothetical protein
MGHAGLVCPLIMPSMNKVVPSHVAGVLSPLIMPSMLPDMLDTTRPAHVLAKVCLEF